MPAISMEGKTPGEPLIEKRILILTPVFCTLHPEPSTLNPEPSTLNPDHRPPHSDAATARPWGFRGAALDSLDFSIR